VVVSGATGRVGSAVVRALVKKRGTSEGLFLLVRDPEKASALHGVDLECLHASYDDEDALATAFGRVPEGFHLFVACNNGPSQAALEANICRSAQARGCGYVVKLSTATPVLEMKEGGPYAAHLEVEALLSQLGLPHAILRPNLFLDEVAFGSFLGVSTALLEADSYAHPFATSPISAVDVRDVAACAAALLDGASPEPGTTPSFVEISGPSAICLGEELASAISEVRPRRVAIEECSVEAFLARRELPAPAAQSLAGFLRVLKERCAPTSDTVLQLTGQPARSVREFVLDHAVSGLDSNAPGMCVRPACAATRARKRSHTRVRSSPTLRRTAFSLRRSLGCSAHRRRRSRRRRESLPSPSPRRLASSHQTRT
jgi:uncharacterized protein YbjT (DUF2867 family)